MRERTSSNREREGSAVGEWGRHSVESLCGGISLCSRDMEDGVWTAGFG